MVLSGTALGQAINLLSYPIIARLYLPADFGIFALFLSIASVPGVISGWRFELAIPTVSRAGYVAAYWLCVTLSFLSGVLAAVATAIFSAIATTGWGPLIPPLIGLAVFLTGFSAASTMYLLRQDGYRTTSAGIVLRTAVVVGGQILLAFLWPDSFGLILGYCLGFVIQGLFLGYFVAKKLPKRLPRVRRLAVVFRRYRRQVAIDVPSTLLGSLSINLMAPLLILLYSSSAAGIYALAARVAVVPMQVFNDALGQVFFQKAARAQETRGGFWPEFKFSLLASSGIAVLVIAGITVLAEPFVNLYLGDRWAASGTVLVILAPMVGLNSICMSVATSVFVLKRVHWLLFLNVGTAMAQFAAFGIGWAAALELNAFLLLTVVLMSKTYVVFILFLARAVRSGHAGAAAPAAAPVAPGNPL